MYLITAEKWAITAPIGRGKARGVEFVRGAHRETELRKKLKPTQPANSSVRPWKGGVPIYNVQFGGGTNYLLATNTRTAPVHADRRVTRRWTAAFVNRKLQNGSRDTINFAPDRKPLTQA